MEHICSTMETNTREKGVLLEMIDKLQVGRDLTHFQSTSHFDVDKA